MKHFKTDKRYGGRLVDHMVQARARPLPLRPPIESVPQTDEERLRAYCAADTGAYIRNTLAMREYERAEYLRRWVPLAFARYAVTNNIALPRGPGPVDYFPMELRVTAWLDPRLPTVAPTIRQETPMSTALPPVRF